MEEEKIRLFVGGLAAEVSADDLQERFAPLGNVQNITLPPVKAGGPGHRGFAYVDFVPKTDASLRKLFSAYNGCKWRGGKLRIEKAAEHYSDKLHREWAVEAASLIIDPPAKEIEVVQKSPLTGGWQKQVNGANKGDMEASDLKIFFPRLRKLKDVPLTGLGKHKRSFQRFEASPLQSLSYCACAESLRSGSCSCSNINGDTSSVKQDTGCEKDDISQAVEIERQRQIDLLNRLFPSDSTSISSENQQVVELDDNEETGIIKDEGTVGSIEKTFSDETLQPPITKRVKHEAPKHLLQRNEIRSIVEKGHNEYLNSKMDSENRENGFEADSTAILVANERAMQLELMHRLFPEDASSARESDQVLQPEVGKIKKKRKLDASAKSSDLIETVMVTPGGTTTESSMPLGKPTLGSQSAEHHQLAKEQEHEMEVLDSNPAVGSDDSLDGASEMVLNLGVDSAPLSTAEDQERQLMKSITTVTTDVLEDESQMILNVGDDSLPLAIVEEQEKHELKNLSVRANELLEKVSEISRHLRDDSLSLANAEVRERQTPESPQSVISEDGSEDLEMTLNFGDDSVPLSKAEEEERALVRMLPTWELDEARHYDGTFSDPEEPEEAEGSGTEEHSSEEEENSEGTRVAEEADEALDNKNEEHSSELQDNSESSSDAEEPDEAVDSENEEHSSELQDYSQSSSDAEEDEDEEAVDSENEEHSSELQDYSGSSSDAEEADEEDDSEDEDYFSEEQDDFLHEEYSEMIPQTRRTESKLAEASLKNSKGESAAGKQPEEASKWAALAEMCQFRTEEIMQPEESKLEGNSITAVATSNKDEDVPSTEVPGFQVVEASTISQQHTESENNRVNSDDPSSSGQKLTRAAWKSLVGETGRVVFSLRQITGLSLPQTPSLTQETQTIVDAGQGQPSLSSKASNHNQAKSKVAVSTAQKKDVGVVWSTEPKMDAAELLQTPVTPIVSSSDVCPFMKSENAEKEWLATKSDLRSDYRAKQKYAARNDKKLWGRR